MLSSVFDKVCIESYAFNRPTISVSTDEIEDRLAPLYKRYMIPFGTLSKLSGINTRGFFEKGTLPSEIATEAARMTLKESGIDKKDIGAVFSCSVTRDFFEPATSVLVHQNLGLSEEVMALDITNACIGFSNGMLMAANLIESGAIKAALVVSGENMAPIVDTTFEKLLSPEAEKISRSEFVKMLPTFTLGSGGVAMLMCHQDIATKHHRFVAAHARSASQHSDLCVGNGDFCFTQTEGLDPLMETQSKKLVSAASKLGARAWPEFAKLSGWKAEELDHLVCHQVGKQVNASFYEPQGLPYEKEHTVYQDYGNLVSAAMPSAMISTAEEGKFMTGDKILLTGYGSGLNTMFSGIVW